MDAESIRIDDPRELEITTISKTRYLLSPPNEDGLRNIRRIAVGQSSTRTFSGKISEKYRADPADISITPLKRDGYIREDSDRIYPTTRKEFRGRLKSSITPGQPLYIEIEDATRVLVSENVESIKA
jgi:hypothetical protein